MCKSALGVINASQDHQLEHAFRTCFSMVLKGTSVPVRASINGKP